MTNHTATRNRFKAKAGSASSKAMDEQPRKDICQAVTDSIVKVLESGNKPWGRTRWDNIQGGFCLPRRHTGEKYRGINVILLWSAMEEHGFSSSYFLTYRQAAAMGANVKKGEHGTTIVFYGTAGGKDDDQAQNGGAIEDKTYRFLRTFTVFNADQVAGLPEHFYAKAEPMPSANERIDELEAIIAATGAKINHGGNQAFYRKTTDDVTMPRFEQFKSAEFYYATLFHELTHWTAPKHRLDRDFGAVTFGDEGYAKEELVAELAAAFMGAEYGFGVDHIEDHAAYLASWLRALKNDKKLIFMAAAKAQTAVDYLTAGIKAQQLVAA